MELLPQHPEVVQATQSRVVGACCGRLVSLMYIQARGQLTLVAWESQEVEGYHQVASEAYQAVSQRRFPSLSSA